MLVHFFGGKIKTKASAGFTLVEAMIVLLIFSLIAVCFYQTAILGIKYIRESKFKLEATALANEKMEIIRNLDYDDIGTTTSVPRGDILAEETVIQNTNTYYVSTFIKYIDDAYDGKQGLVPNDAIPNDYKEVKITVAWGTDPMKSRTVFLVSIFSPIGVEKSVGGGTLALNILDNSGNGIPQAQVRIKNQSEGVDMTVSSDDTGNISLPSMPVGDRNYSLEVSKSGYYSANTYPPYPTSTFNPVDIHASVIADTLNMKAVITDKISSINLTTEDPLGNRVKNIGFNLSGGRKQGDTLDVPSVELFTFNQNLNSGETGEKILENMSYGTYTFVFSDSTSQYRFIKVDPGQNLNVQFDLAPNTAMDVKAIFADKTADSLLIKVVRASDESIAIEGASVNLKNETAGYDVTLTTDKYGLAFFPTTLPYLAKGTYQIKVAADGFNDNQSDISIEGLVSETVKLISE